MACDVVVVGAAEHCCGVHVNKETAPLHRLEMLQVAVVATIELSGPRTISGHHLVYVAPISCAIGALQVAPCHRVFVWEASSFRRRGSIYSRYSLCTVCS